VAFNVMRAITGQGAYANLALADGLEGCDPREAAAVTDLVAGTCRALTTLDRVIEAAAGRSLRSLQPAVVDLLRLGVYELCMGRTPVPVAVSTYVELARATVGNRVTGVVNAVLRKVADKTLDQWVDDLAGGDVLAAEALRTWHPAWIVEVYRDLLGPDEASLALAANNRPATTTLAVHPGLASVDALVAEGAEAGRWSPYAATVTGQPGRLAAVRDGLAAVQDEGSQLVCLALARAEAPAGDWLDCCAGPGGKTVMLAGLMAGVDGAARLLAADKHQHRAELTRQAVRAYPDPPVVVVADATRPAWPTGHFARVLADVPCTGLGALRRRPDARWRRQPGDVDELHALQAAILSSAIDSAKPGGVVAYVTCSPHRHETADVVAEVLVGRPQAELLDAPALLADVPDCASPIDPRFVQLWPHRHGTDAMFLALIRRF